MINYLFKEQNWQKQLSDLITDPAALLKQLNLSEHDLLDGAILANNSFKLRVPRAFVAKMQRSNPTDPLLLQVLPHHLELQDIEGYSLDPLQELDANPNPGILHKYQSRFLLTLTGACAIHCRYCFRRHFPYQENLPKTQDWPAMRDYIQANPQINEVILSGGDPLSLSNQKLAIWFDRLAQVSQLKILRIHTRVPIVIPERIDDELISLIKNSRLRVVVVVHSNHAQELDDFTCEQLKRLALHDVTVLNQTVMLKHVNDSAEVLTQLSHRLFEARVMPYYLHVLDKVKGAHHFDVTMTRVNQIYTELLANLPGYMVPKLVREIAGENNKTPLFGMNTD